MRAAARRGRHDRPRRRPWPWLLGVAAAWVALRLLPTAWIDALWVERLLPWLARWQAPAVAAAPVSLTLLSALAYAAAVVVALALPGPRRRPGDRLGWALVALLACGPAFELTWGLGYRRAPIEARLALPAAAPTAADAWAALARAEAAVAVPGSPTGSPTVSPASVALDAPWWTAALPAAAACVARADAFASGRPAPLALAPTVRRLPAGTLLRSGFAGVQAPWWREPHVDGGLPPAAALATSLHEMAHAAGWAREAETDALALLAGIACDDPEVRFAAGQAAVALVHGELARLDPEARARLDARREALPAAVPAAWAAAREASARYRTPALERVAGAAYDAYLRGQGVSAGLADYGRAGVVVVAALVACDREPESDAPWCVP